VTGTCHHIQLFSVELGCFKHFVQAGVKLILLISASYAALMTGADAHHHDQLLVEMEYCELPAPAGHDLPNLSLQEARITGTSFWSPAAHHIL
jgi:hypothetical protein